MDINIRIKRLYAALKRLNIGQYLADNDFNLFLIENNLDGDWKKFAKEVAIDRNINWRFFHSDNATFDELEEILSWFLGAKYYNEFSSFHELILPLLLGFAKWSSVRLDYTSVVTHLKTLDVSEENILKFAKEFRQIQGLKRESAALSENKIEVTTNINLNSVFIVHGHDSLAQTEVARFIERLCFVPVILHEQANTGKTIIEKIETYTNVGFGIVLYTPCDLGAVKGQEAQLRPRARQNVLLEHGYLMSKLGRRNVCALVKGDVELPTDISGIVYVHMDERKAWQTEVAREMKACGYQVDMNKLLQHA